MINAQRRKIARQQAAKSLHKVRQAPVRRVKGSERTRMGIISIEDIQRDGVQQPRRDADETLR